MLVNLILPLPARLLMKCPNIWGDALDGCQPYSTKNVLEVKLKSCKNKKKDTRAAKKKGRKNNVKMMKWAYFWHCVKKVA